VTATPQEPSWAQEAVDAAGGLDLLLTAAAAPSNNPVLSPAVWKALIDTGGGSAVRGLRALGTDLAAPPRVPSMVAANAFEVGRDLAVTPGGVVYACEQFELIQSQPAGESVYRYPLLIVPPTINKYYIVDLAPGRSLAEFLVGQGHQVFVVSWRNPDARHRDWGLDTYGGAIVAALDAVRAIGGAPKASVLALCSGGIAAARRAAPRLHQAGPGQRADRAGPGDHAGLAGRPDHGRRGCLRHRRLGRPPVPVAVLLPDQATARRPGHVRAVHQRAYCCCGQSPG
jgi:polyhydroxyalkanoate synthase subunit PhaC